MSASIVDTLFNSGIFIMVHSHARKRDLCDINDSTNVHMTFKYWKKKNTLRLLALFPLAELFRNLVAHGDAGRGSEGETGEWSG